MDLVRILLLASLIFSLSSCKTRFSETTFVTENEDSYECLLLTPKESKGYFIYLSDSNEVISYPTPLMDRMLRDQYTIVIPKRWGNNARSLRKLDSYEHRLQGVSYALTEILGDSTGETIFFAEGFYTPIAMRLAKNFRPQQLWMIEPRLEPLSLTVFHQYQLYESASPILSVWEMDSVSELSRLTQIINNEPGFPPEFYGPHYSTFIQSYWEDLNSLSWVHTLDSTEVKVIFQKNYPFYSEDNKHLWESQIKMSIPLPEEMDTSNYSVTLLEEVFISN